MHAQNSFPPGNLVPTERTIQFRTMQEIHLRLLDTVHKTAKLSNMATIR